MASSAEVVKKFFITSVFMWVLPIAVIYGFQNNLFPGVEHISPYYQTLLVGFLAVISVNVVIVLYICMAMKEPSDKHEPDPKFVAEAKASINQSKSESHDKKEE
ncbi:Vacuolar ATPase assembly integral membrane protein vma21 [Bienertia sinuspersici]